MYQDHTAPVPECQCFPVPERYWTTHYGAVDPATMFEPNPACPEHFPENAACCGGDGPGCPMTGPQCGPVRDHVPDGSPFPVTQEFTPQGDSGVFDPWDPDGDSPTIGPRLTRNAEGVHVPEDSVLREGERIHYDPREYARAAVERLANRPLLHEMLRAAENTPSPIRYASDTDTDTVPEEPSLQSHLDKFVQRYNDQGDLSAREVLASCDHTRFGTVTRRVDDVWVPSCSGCRADLQAPEEIRAAQEAQLAQFEVTIRESVAEMLDGELPGWDLVVGAGVSSEVRDHLARELSVARVRQADQEHVEGALRDWVDRAEDYLAQENPPLPPARHLPEPDRTIFRLGSLLSPVEGRPAFLTGEELRDLAIDRVAGIAEVRGLRSNTPRTDAELIVDAVLKVVLDAMNGGRR